MTNRILWIGLYALLLLCFFLTGFYFPNLALAGFYMLPFMLSILYGYFKRVTGAFSTFVVGLALYGLMAVISCGVLATFESFWIYIENLPIIWAEINTFNEALAGVMILLIGVFASQIPLGAFGVFIGIGIDKLGKTLQRSKERIITYGNFTNEGVTKTGVVKVRVIGTIPENLYEWMKKEIEAGNFVNQSHIMEAALKQLKEKAKK
ncbi:MAG: hypothetical protein ACE5KD_03780 [Candidatus Bathyarchaeia archaeon]